VVVAIMGLNGRGSYHASSFSSLENVEVGYICDVKMVQSRKVLMR